MSSSAREPEDVNLHHAIKLQNTTSYKRRKWDNNSASWWRHQMETFSALLAIRAGNSPVPGDVTTQRPVTRSFAVFFDLRLNKRLSKQTKGW